MSEFSPLPSPIGARAAPNKKVSAKAPTSGDGSGRPRDADFRASMQAAQKQKTPQAPEKPAAAPRPAAKAEGQVESHPKSKTAGPAGKELQSESPDVETESEPVLLDAVDQPLIAQASSEPATGIMVGLGSTVAADVGTDDALTLLETPTVTPVLAEDSVSPELIPMTEASVMQSAGVEAPDTAEAGVGAWASHAMIGNSGVRSDTGPVAAESAGQIIDDAAAGDTLLTPPQQLATKNGQAQPAGEAFTWRGQPADAGQALNQSLNTLETDFSTDSALSAEAEPLAQASGAETLQLSRMPGGALHAGALNGKISMPVNVPFSSEQWQNAVGERAVLLVRQNIQTAELQLDPPELGPLQVRIQLNNDHATVNFTSANPQVREALDQTMVRLKEMLQEQGYSNVQTGVSDHSDRGGRQQRATQGRGGEPSAEVEADSAPAEALQANLRSGIDYFA